MSLYQLRVYCMKADGMEGVESMHELSHLKKPRSKKDPRWKILKEIASRAAKNIIAGNRWDHVGD